MINLPEEKVLYSEIQKKLFYIIPEKWESIFLYASIIDVPNQKPVGEMYFYYLPKGIIRKKYVNGYEIPNLFNIEEEQYSKLITDVYNTIKLLREAFIKAKKRVWSNISISIENFQFKVEYDYENLLDSEYNSYERHIIWRYNYLKEEIDLFSKRDRKIIDNYRKKIALNRPPKKEMYFEGMYRLPVKNIIDYERTLTVEEALEQSRVKIKKKKEAIIKSKKKSAKEDDEDDGGGEIFNNQILNFKK